MNILAIGVVLIGLGTADPTPEEVAAHLGQARFAGWQMTHDAILPKLLPEDETKQRYSGLVAFAADIEKVAGKLNFKGDPKTFPGIDCDVLVTKNPHFWRANYEVAPGDPAWMSLHAGLLLAGGEASRARAILLLAKSRPGIPKVMIQAMDHLLSHAGRLLADGNAAVRRGILVYDKGDREGALKLYEEALRQWPQNGWCHYEIGMTRMMTRMEAAEGGGEDTVIHTPEVVASYAESRRHDPFQVKAYQGSDPDVTSRLNAALRIGPLYKKIEKGGPTRPITLDEMIAFSNALQTAGQDELALVARQVAVIRRGDFRPEDHPFLTKGLRRLAPGDDTETVLKRMMGPPLSLRQLMVLEPNEGK